MKLKRIHKHELMLERSMLIRRHRMHIKTDGLRYTWVRLDGAYGAKNKKGPWRYVLYCWTGNIAVEMQ